MRSHMVTSLVVIGALLAMASARPGTGAGRGLMAGEIPSSPLSIEIDPLAIGKAIADAVHADADRAGFVKNLCETAYNNPKINGKYNVMVFNLGQNYDKALNDVVLYGSAVTDGVTFGVWAFKDGTFHNGGDGGYINWCFQGHFTRSGKQGHDVAFTS